MQQGILTSRSCIYNFLNYSIHRYCINDNLALSNVMGEFYKMPLLCAALSTLIMKLKMSS